jgi:transcriptional regulator with XRE-family HTH domain
METVTTFGRLVPDRPVATGAVVSMTRWVGCAAAVGATLFGGGTGGEFVLERVQRTAASVQPVAQLFDFVELASIRSPAENLARIREVLKPAVSDLATAFGVSRQSIYNWLNGDPLADGNATRLQDLAQAADVLANEGIAVTAALLKRKFANGRTLLQVSQVGESAVDAARLLVQIHKRETIQRERMNARLVNRAKTPPTADFDLPASNDHV